MGVAGFLNPLSIGTPTAPAGLTVSTSTGGSSSNWYDPANYAGWIFNNYDNPSHYGLLVSDYWRNNENFVFAVDGRFFNSPGTIASDTHNPYFIVRGDGNVGVGTASPGYKLDVAGSIGAQAIFVTENAWPDNVFDSTYRNRPLSEVEAYINQNHHLPDVPSEAEVKEKGVSVGDMQAKLLAKIEELTLHMIEADKKIRDLQAQLADRAAK